MGFQEFGFGQDDEEFGGKSNRFKGQAGTTYRVSFAWWPGVEDGVLQLDAKTPRFAGCKRHYLAGVGYFINNGPEYTKLAGSDPKDAIATVIVNWPLDSQGDLDKAAMAAGKVQVQPWVVSSDKYEQWKSIHKEFHFGEHDVKVVCTDTQYQKMQFVSCKNSILAKLAEKAPDSFDKIVTKIKNVAASVNRELGQNLSLDDLRSKLQGKGGNPAGAAPDPVSTKEIDNLIDDMLD